MYQAALRAELAERLGVEWGPVRNGHADLAGVPRPPVEQLKEMLGDSHAKTLALDHVPDAGAEAMQDSLTRFSVPAAGERRARSDRERAEEMRGGTEERLAGLRDERRALGRLVHRQERAELDDHIAGHEPALAHWDDSAQRADQALTASAAARDAWLEEHGETTLALVRAEQQRRADDLDELRSDLATRAQDLRPLGARRARRLGGRRGGGDASRGAASARA
jgi:hypothetical protein